MKKIFSNYYKPTPKLARKIGDALLAVSTFITASSMASSPKFAMGSMIVGVIGKFLSNMFSADTTPDDTTKQA